MSGTEVVVITHGEASRCMVETAERMVGSLGVRTICVRVGEPRDETERHIRDSVGGIQGGEILFLTDLEGATPYNLCCETCRERSIVLSGMNLPMLFKLATADRERGARALAEELRATGVKSIHIHSAADAK